MFWFKKSKQTFGMQYREQTSMKISWGHWFAFFNILWAILIGSRYAFIIDWPETFFGKLYFFISLLGHFSFVGFALYLLVVFPLSFIIKNERTFRGVSVIIATISTTLLLVDTEVFVRFNFHLSSVVWNLLVNPENGELSRDWQIFFVPMPLMLLVQMLFSRWAWYKLRSLERQKWFRGVGVLFTCLFVATHLIYAWADAYIYRPITMQKSNFPLSYPMTARSFLEKHGFLDIEEYNSTLEQEGRPEAPAIIYPKHPLTFATSNTEKANLLIITVSGLRADALQNMPNLHQFAQNATQFTHHYSSGNTNNTGLTGLFYGLNANYTDSLLNHKTPSVLIEKLKQDHYQFGLFSATNFKDTLFEQALFNGMKLPTSKRIQPSNESAVKNWQDWYLKRDETKPWFSYLNLDLSDLMHAQKIDNLADEQALYQTQLAKLDEQLAKIFTQLNESQQLDNTAVVITAEHGYVFQASEQDVINNFSDEQVQVPMIVAWRELASGKEDKLSSHVDILPALMYHLFWVQNPDSDYSQGHNLFDFTQSRNWVLAANYRWFAIITANGTQYHIDRKGNYQKFDRTYEKQASDRPPLGLFLDVFNQSGSFIEK
ncbi:hypothetical protein C8D76_102174 [Pasteurella langaaensis DSM 22999]|uniref:DUF3413 domain-containing protein n=1 Tax=Alitibacter langaaensis DSM 22999 TaxID=1122935 RepID=A0A2U0TD48_9PAST|nr:DUF3413 domain-containing protein [Pasteurella langaaensis]PVX41477.1 hypothetical protein C8D76_102174 [Pasteurella langaaensis DSM 22999]